ncbi:MAG: heparinase II/III family protein [Minwuia sp.]|nr:heparinase II/III family protein [Minwuia sp.]
MRLLFQHLTLGMALTVGLAAQASAEGWYDPHQNPPTLPRSLQDWITPQGGKEMREMPEDNLVALENPPAFGWRSGQDRYSFEVLIARDGKRYMQFVTQATAFRPDRPMEPGRYTWQVRRLDSFGRPLPDESSRVADPEGWSTPRVFEVRRDGIALSVPPVWDAFDRARTRKRPRSLPADPASGRFNPARLTPAQWQVFETVARRFVKEAPEAGSVASRRSDGSRSALRQTMRRINDALAVATVHRQKEVRQQATAVALLYLDNLIGENPLGRTGHDGNDLLNIRLAKTVARAYDILKSDMDRQTQLRVRRHIEDRTQPAFDYFMLNDHGNLEQFALSSHGFQIMTHVLAIAALLSGDSDRARLWFRDSYPLISMIVTPWGGGDGGYSNGVNYGVWEFVNHVDSWDVIHNSTGFPYFDTAWVRNFAEFLTYFAPPGVAYAGFGDGGENLRPELWSEVARLYSERGRGAFADPLLESWQTHLEARTGKAVPLTNALLWPRLFSDHSASPDTAQRLDAIPDAAIFPDIGWGAIHTDINDPERYSVLFKASQFGSFSHSHADQNAFTIMGRGKPLLLDSGYYDDYRSRHHDGWTRQTRAHNAITFDGGKGQPIDDPGAKGRLLGYWRCGDVVVMRGDASGAYGQGISRALRTLISLPDGRVLVADRMVADSARKWEWNFHAAEPLSSAGSGFAVVRNGGAVATIQVLVGPDLELERSRGFPFPAKTKNGIVPVDQYHAAFISQDSAPSLDMLTLIDLDRDQKATDASARLTGAGRISFRVGQYAGTIDNGEVSLDVDGAAIDPTTCAVPPPARVATQNVRLRLGGRN